MAIAEHNPSKLYAKNRGVLKMSHAQLHDFAASKPAKGRAMETKHANDALGQRQRAAKKK